MIARQVILYSKERKVIKTFNSIGETAIYYSISPQLLRQKINNNECVWKDGAHLSFGEKHEFQLKEPKSCKCVDCGSIDENDFYNGNKNRCRKCESIKNTQHYHSLNNIEKKEKMVIQKKWREDNYIQYRVCSAKHRAKRKKISFELTNKIIEEKLLKQNNRCYISNQEFSFVEDDWHCMSLDRLDSNMGYTVDNTILVTKFVNMTKNRLDLNV
jgi:hypothetical protein